MRTQIIGLMQDILPKYDGVKEGGHGRGHIIDVIKKSYDMAIEFNEDPEVCCVAALFHDIGLLTNSRSVHHISSAIYVAENLELLRRYFSDDDIYKIFSAVLEHRSGYKDKYTSMVSKIVSDADRSTDIYRMISRSYAYNKSKGYEEDRIYNEVYSHLKEKYYERTYNFLSSKLQKDLNDAREILKNEEEFKKYYKEITANL